MMVCLILQYSLVLIVSYNASLLNGFHFGEKLGEILFESVVLDGFYGISLGQTMFGNGNCAIKSENVRGGDSIDDFRGS